jgi:hypothetical protein
MPSFCKSAAQTSATRLATNWLAVAILALLMIGQGHAQLPARTPDQTLTGTLKRSDSATYQAHTFEAPAGASRLVLALDHDGDPNASLIELGVADPIGFRGASSKKPFFTIAESDATPGYLAGRIPSGTWKLNFSVGQLPDKPLNWRVRVWYMKAGEILPAPVMGHGPGWYRGDMHIHTGHSDGFCANQSGLKTPCPMYNSIVTASTRNLDFVMLTEHNTVSHAQVIRELQPSFDKLLLIPGQEVTTFYGHISVWGVDQPIDYRIVPGQRSFGDIADDVHRLGGILSANHPAAPTGAMCLGCGWSMPDMDFTKLDGVEAVNGSIVGMTGGNVEGALSGLPFWLDALSKGHRLLAVGGSDTHDGAAPAAAASTIGKPTTVVYASELTQPAILAGLKSGRVFVDVTGDPAGMLDFEVSSGKQKAVMGGAISAGRKVAVRVDAKGPAGSMLELMDGGKLLASRPLGDAGAYVFNVELTKGLHPLRVQVRGANGRLVLLSNAVMATRTR